MSATFPVDDVTLAILAQACEIGDDGKSHLHDFLDFGSVEASREQLDGNVYEVSYEPGREPWSVNQVIPALVAEIQRLRVVTSSPHRATITEEKS